MVSITVDTSVTMAWCFRDEATPYARSVFARLRTTGAVAPVIWTLEVANALLMGERRQRLTQNDVVRFIQILRGLPITVDDQGVAGALGPILHLARAQNLTAYDASYLELALREGLPLATQDNRLRAAASAIGIPLVTADEH